MIIVTGATGFLGRFVVNELLALDLEFRCLVRKTSNTDFLSEKSVDRVEGDLDYPETLINAFSGCSILINLASLGFGHAEGIIHAAEVSGIKRAIFISTTAVFTTLPAESKKIRLAAEEAIQGSQLEYTILRPTMIYGTSNDRNMARLIRFVNKYPLVPVFGRGSSLIQPIYVEDLAKAVVKVLQNDRETVYKAYNLAGEKPISYSEAVEVVGRVLGKKARRLNLPVELVLFLLRLYRMVSGKSVFTEEQVLRLQEDKAFSFKEAEADFAFSSRSFEEGIKMEIDIMRMKGLI